MVAIVTRAGKGSPLTNNEVDANFTNLNSAVQPAGGTAGQILAKINGTDYNSSWIDNFSTALKIQVKNKTGSTINKGAVVYASGGTGANLLIGLAKADAEATSSQVLGFLDSTLATGGIGYVIFTGTITGVDTSAYADGDPVFLSPTTAGGIVVGIANKPSAPAHLVYLGTITRSHAIVGEIQVRVSNGWELEELHNVSITSPSDKQVLQFEASTSLWKNQTVDALPSQTGNSGKWLCTNGTTASWQTMTSANDGTLTLGVSGTGLSGSATFTANQAGASTFTVTSNATNANTASTIVARDASGNFSAGTITANLTGTASTASTANALNTANNYQVNSLGVGTAGSGTAGEIRATNDITAYYSSDRKFKENIKEVNNALDIAVAIGSKTFDWTDEYIAAHGGEDGYFIKKSDFGVIAQDVQDVFPQAVRVRPDGTLAVDYEKLGTLAFGAISQLLKRIEALESK